MSAPKEPAKTFDPAFWHEHWREAAPGVVSSKPVHPSVLQEAESRPARSDSPTALDVGCGAGAEAFTLALAGWRVTAVDTSADALEIAAERAASLGLEERITWVQADATSWSPASTFDLVTCLYVHTLLPQPELLSRLASWVAPRGTLLMVGHAPGSPHHHHHGHPPEEAADQLEPLAAALARDSWSIRAARSSRTVSRNDGQPETLHDVVLRAGRR